MNWHYHNLRFIAKTFMRDRQGEEYLWRGEFERWRMRQSACRKLLGIRIPFGRGGPRGRVPAIMIIIIVLRVREVTVAATATTSSNNLAANRHWVKSTKCLLNLNSDGRYTWLNVPIYIFLIYLLA